MHPLPQGQATISSGTTTTATHTIATGTLGLITTAGEGTTTDTSISGLLVGEKSVPVGGSDLNAPNSDLGLPNPNPESAPDLADLEKEKKRVEQSIYNKLKGMTHIYTIILLLYALIMLYMYISIVLYSA